MKIKRGAESTDEVTEMIQKANEKSDEWMLKLNAYYKFTPNNAQKEGMILFFPSTDGMNKTEIRWNDFIEMIETKRGRIASFALRYGGPTITIDNFPEYLTRIVKMEEIYDMITRGEVEARPRGNRDREAEEETKTEKAARLRATLRKDVVSSFNKIMRKFKDMTLGNKTRLPLDFSESRTQLEKKLVEGYISTHDDIKKNDKDWDGPDGIIEIEVTEFWRDKEDGDILPHHENVE